MRYQPTKDDPMMEVYGNLHKHKQVKRFTLEEAYQIERVRLGLKLKTEGFAIDHGKPGREIQQV